MFLNSIQSISNGHLFFLSIKIDRWAEARRGQLFRDRAGPLDVSVAVASPPGSCLWKGLIEQPWVRQPGCVVRFALPGITQALARRLALGSQGPLGGLKSITSLRSSLQGGEWSRPSSLLGGSWRRVCEFPSPSKDAAVTDGCFLAKPRQSWTPAFKVSGCKEQDWEDGGWGRGHGTLGGGKRGGWGWMPSGGRPGGHRLEGGTASVVVPEEIDHILCAGCWLSILRGACHCSFAKILNNKLILPLVQRQNQLMPTVGSQHCLCLNSHQHRPHVLHRHMSNRSLHAQAPSGVDDPNSHQREESPVCITGEFVTRAAVTKCCKRGRLTQRKCTVS